MPYPKSDQELGMMAKYKVKMENVTFNLSKKLKSGKSKHWDTGYTEAQWM